MFNPSIADLAEMVDGHVQLGIMPPLAGMCEPIGRIVVDSREVRPRDVLWAFAARSHDVFCTVDEAYSRGALGVVVQGRRIEPWAGKFSVTVRDLAVALHRFLRCLQPDAGTWQAKLFADDEHTARVLDAVRQGDSEMLQEVVSRLEKRTASVA